MGTKWWRFATMALSPPWCPLKDSAHVLPAQAGGQALPKPDSGPTYVSRREPPRSSCARSRTPQDARPIRSENRAILVASIARGRRWLDELIADPTANTESIAGREDCSVRKVNMTISLAFLAPDLVKAAIDGRLPHGMGVARLCDLPAEWSRQRQMLGLAAR